MRKYFYCLTLIIVSFLIFSPEIFAQTPERVGRWIDLEWEEVPGAKGYDLELFEVIEEKEFSRGIFHTDIPHWSKEANPGQYNVKIRALDSRKVPGPWGSPIPVEIRLSPAQLIRPLKDEVLTSNEQSDLLVTFQWSSVKGAGLYQLIIFNSKDKVITNQTTKDTELKISIPRTDIFKWFVLPIFTSAEQKDPQYFLSKQDDGLISKNFSIKGPTLKTPVIDIEIVKMKGFIFRWPEVFRAENYSYDVFKLNEETENKELKKVFSGNNLKRQIVIGKDKIPTGTYTISIKATAKDYQDSESARVIFRTDKNNFEVVSNESINKEVMNRALEASSLELQFGYINLNYTSQHYETDTFNEQKLKGLQLQGRWGKNISNNRYKNLVKFDIAQVADSNADAIFFGLSETIGREYTFSQSKIFLAGGIRLDSAPLLYANRATQTIESESLKSMGPEFNFQYNYRWNSTWSNEFRSSFFAPVFAISSPDSAKLKTSLSYDLELKVLYTINGNFDFYTGINHTNHSVKLKAITGGTSLAFPDDVNEIKFDATYLTFGLKYFY